ncbi:MAG TPA: hypothetical protein VHP34_04185 [Alphaproteobacteria bacterium]|jgi:uncharacterized protein YceK|nr:hypothetical protein [Alphaproteobacteria bacterium]
MRKIIPIFAVVLLCGCATVVSGTQQSVFVETPFVEGAECSLRDSKSGSWYLPGTPGSASVTKGDGPLNIVCKKKGYVTGTVSVDDEFAGATLGNIILGGGIGIFVDAASGAAQKYPDKIVVWMKPEKWKSATERKEWEKAKAEYEAEIQRKIEAEREAQRARQNR